MKSYILPLALCVLVMSACSPTDYKVEREILIDAPADLVFSLVNNHKERDAWSPWEAMDSNMTKTYEGPESGAGAIYKWTGNDSVGTGWMEILESEPNIRIKSKLVFTEPWQSESTINWRFIQVDNSIKAVWTINGQLPGYLFWMDQSDMEEQMAPDFERGLENLKRVAEERALKSKQSTALSSELVTTISKPYYYIKSKAPISALNGEFFDEKYSKLMTYLGADAEKNMNGSPFAIYSVWDEQNNMAELAVALPCQSKKPENGEIKKGNTYEGDAIKCKYKGSYENISAAHDYLNTYARDYGYAIVGSPWEVYLVGQSTESDPKKWVTEVYYPVKKV